MRFKKPFSAGKRTFVIFMALLLASAIVPAQAQAQKFKVLHTFHGANGANPFAVLVRDAAGNLYGTTASGGNGKGVCVSFFSGCGTAFKLDKTGKQVWLHSFTGQNGNEPLAGLTRDGAGNLYGTTYLGGDTKCQQYGCGTVFKLDKSGKERVLHKFTGSDGFFLDPLLARDAAGSLYGTTQAGLGNVFKMDRSGKLTVLTPVPFCFLILQETSTARRPPGAVAINAEARVVGQSLSCRPSRMEAGRKVCFTASARSTTALMGGSLSGALWCETLREACTEPPILAGPIETVTGSPVGSSSGWTPPARKPCCTASLAGRMARTLQQA
jgi:uncharacterized repeat protein (TIGR03803 family)